MTVKSPSIQPIPLALPQETGEGASELLGSGDPLKPEAGAIEHVPYEILRSPEDRMRYLQLTDNLIRQMVEKETEVAIFLDKSARPVAWMVHALWDQLVPPAKPDGTAYKEPELKFLNIDREQWEAVVGRTEDGMIDVGTIPHERIDELRKVMAPVGKLVEEEDPAPEASMLSGKKVMVIDEVRVSGDTLRIADRILNRAFPDASEIVPVSWMDGQVKVDPRSGQRSNTELPIWYNERRVTGRGVGDRDTTKAANSASERSRIGRYWLSTRFKEPDTEGIQLRRETKQMAADLEAHRILYRPSPNWNAEIESVDDRIERINGISVEQYKNLRVTSRNAEELIARLGRVAGA